MQRKFIHIFTIALLSTFFVDVSLFAQEGEDLPIRPSSANIEKDSVSLEEGNTEELKSDVLPVVTIFPGEQKVPATSGENNPVKPAAKKPEAVAGEKEQENPSNLSFNFIYYLFYKFKVGSTSSN